MARAKDGEKQALILECALAVFGELGYQATKISDIAERAGIAQGTLYTYFRDKEELFRAAVSEGWSRFLTKMGEIIATDEPVEERLRRFLDSGFRTLKEVLPLLRGMLFESLQMHLLESNLDALCTLVEELLSQRRARLIAGSERAARRSLIRVILVGVLFSAALTGPDRTDREINATRRWLMKLMEPA